MSSLTMFFTIILYCYSYIRVEWCSTFQIRMHDTRKMGEWMHFNEIYDTREQYVFYSYIVHVLSLIFPTNEMHVFCMTVELIYSVCSTYNWRLLSLHGNGKYALFDWTFSFSRYERKCRFKSNIIDFVQNMIYFFSNVKLKWTFFKSQIGSKYYV